MTIVVTCFVFNISESCSKWYWLLYVVFHSQSSNSHLSVVVLYIIYYPQTYIDINPDIGCLKFIKLICIIHILILIMLIMNYIKSQALSISILYLFPPTNPNVRVSSHYLIGRYLHLFIINLILFIIMLLFFWVDYPC